MSAESIFHKLFTSENSYTQLLCNLLKRDGEFRGNFFAQFGEHLRNLVEMAEIRTQVGLSGCGQADILIRSRKIDASHRFCMIIEVKTESIRELEPKQHLRHDLANYLHWLQKQMAEGYEAWLVFLVPASWKFRDEIKEEIAAYGRTRPDSGVTVSMILWEEVLEFLPKNNQRRPRWPRSSDCFWKSDSAQLALIERRLY